MPSITPAHPGLCDHWHSLRTVRTSVSDAIIKNHAAFIWSVADRLRGDYKQSDYGKVILPLTVLRRLDCVLEPTKADVLARAKSLKGKIENVGPVLKAVSREQFFNTSPLDFRRLLDDPAQIAGNLRAYIAGTTRTTEPTKYVRQG
jgi:type I restriction enzyme M protein